MEEDPCPRQANLPLAFVLCVVESCFSGPARAGIVGDNLPPALVEFPSQGAPTSEDFFRLTEGSGRGVYSLIHFPGGEELLLGSEPRRRCLVVLSPLVLCHTILPF